MMDELSDSLQLTPQEREILNHRLDVADSIADALEDLHPRDLVVRVAELLRAGRLSDALAVGDALAADVLADAVDGSTCYGASMDVPGAAWRVLRAGESLAEKVSRFIGKRVRFPNY